MVSSLFSLLESPDTALAAGPHPMKYNVTYARPSMKNGRYPEFEVQIKDGVVWFWLLERWQNLPNELWAWKSVTIWTAGHYYWGCNIWVPSLLLFDFWEYDRSSYSPVAVSVTNYFPPVPGPAAAAVIAPHLFEVLRSSGESELCRTCRLVCRDWANACPLRDPEPCDLMFEDGSVWYWIEEEWRYLPSKYWAWTPQYEEWWVDCWEGEWYLKLVRPVDDAVRQSPIYPSVLPLPLWSDSTSTRSRPLTAAALPPELIRYVCEAADNESLSSRMVCRYWNRLCTPRVFERIDARHSPERIRALWRHRTDPLMRHVKAVDGVPQYDQWSKFPWLHLLTQACASTRSVWKEQWRVQGKISIDGPFAGGHRTIRSVHFELPRSLPRSFSRGIKSLYIHSITLSKIEDLVHVVCELPDLEKLSCHSGIETDLHSPPIQLPRRRPRTNRNKLREVDINVGAEDTRPEIALTMYLSVYDAMSFFSGGETTIILALVKLLDWRNNPKLCYEESTHNHSRRLYSTNSFDRPILWSLRILPDLQHNHTILDCAIGCRSTIFDPDCWTQFDAKFDKIKGLIWQANFIFGFWHREHMVEFVTDILEKKMPSISAFATVRYSMHIKDKNSFGSGQWCQASLDSGKLIGTPKTYPWEVYS